MGIIQTSVFDVNVALPLDTREQKADLTARDAIASGTRWEGMEVYVISESKSYKLVGGITNSDWVENGGGSGGGISFKSVTTITASDSIYDILEDPGQLIVMDSFDNNVTAVLPDIDTVPTGWGVCCMRTQSNNRCIIAPNADGSVIEGNTDKELHYQFDKVTFVKIGAALWGLF